MAITRSEIEGIPIVICTCERCKKKWQASDTNEEPLKCAKCGSPYWNRPRKNEIRKSMKPNANTQVDVT